MLRIATLLYFVMMEGLTQLLTRFIGREREIERILDQIGDDHCRLLTLVGVGGTGKTRLAIQTATKHEALSGNAAYFVNLQPVQHAEQLPTAVADAVGVELTGTTSLQQQLLAHLKSAESLLILDNFENLLSDVQQADALHFVSALIANSSSIKLIVTSREPLGLMEEWRYPVAGLRHDTIDSDAALLFIRCATRVSPHFDSRAEADAIRLLCALVGGMPLAIELAASWVKSLSVAEIVEELTESSELLTTDAHNRPDRHRSIQLVIDQTWQRLNAQERSAFTRLAVFRGGFRRQAAKAVANASLPLLASLVDKSLLRLDENKRYQIHELLRQYAEQKLSNSAESARQMHADHYALLAQQWQRDLIRCESNAMHDMRTELDNFRAAWRWSLQHGPQDTTFALAIALSSFLSHRNLNLESVELFEHAVQQQTAPSALYAYLLRCLGQSYIRIGQIEQAAEHLQASLSQYQALEIPHPPGLATDPALYLCIVAWMRSDFQLAVRLAKQALARAEAEGHQRNAAYAHSMLSGAYSAMAQTDDAEPHADAAYKIVQRADIRDHLAFAHIELSKIAAARKDYYSAETHIRAAIAVRRDTQQTNGEAMALAALAQNRMALKEYEGAREAYAQALELHRSTQDAMGAQICLRGLGEVAQIKGQYEVARSHYLDGLKLAIEHNLVAYMGGTLSRVGRLLVSAGHAERGEALLRTVASHPSLAQVTRQQAEAMLGESVELASAEIDVLTLAQHTYTDLHHLVLQPPAEVDQVSAESNQSLIEPLTTRELEILERIAQGMTNRAIADELILSVGTIKWYTQQIYGKLGVKNRTQSVLRAHELNLLST